MLALVMFEMTQLGGCATHNICDQFLGGTTNLSKTRITKGVTKSVVKGGEKTKIFRTMN